MKGLIIDANHENASHIKFVIETVEKKVEMEVVEKKEGSFELIKTGEYDFIMVANNPVKTTDITRNVIPLIRAITEEKADRYIMEKPRNAFFIDPEKIIGIEVINKHCYIFTLKGVRVITRVTLTNLLEIMDIPYIVRCHRAYAVNVKYVEHIHKVSKVGWTVDFIISTDFECRVSDRYIKNLMEVYERQYSIKVSGFVGY